MNHEFRKNHIRIVNTLPGESEVKIRAESEPLHQVILNLLVNSVHAIVSAVKAGRKEEHFIRMGASLVENHWILSIQDTGCGISPNHMKNLFKPFFTTKDVGVGTGLGLATSENILQSWGGNITVESQEGVGSKFSLRLPRA
jgi:signal transduction histidine kinase